MKKILLNVLVMISLSISLFAQPNFEWIKTVGGSGQDRGSSVSTDNLGNVYTVVFLQIRLILIRV